MISDFAPDVAGLWGPGLTWDVYEGRLWDGEVREPGAGGGGQLRHGAQVPPQGHGAAGGHQEVPGERGRQDGQEDRHARGQDAQGTF